MSNFEIVGLMSGTSLDGLDIAHVQFVKKGGNWSFDMINSSSEGYSKEMKLQLKNAPRLSKKNLKLLDVDFADEMSRRVNAFILSNGIRLNQIDAIASHGHTVFHQPQNGFSLQIGCGKTLAKNTGIQVINDFRNKDIEVGGQGAPLVPIGDKKLFAERAEAFLNLGGFCNITFQNEKGNWVAFDISPCNLPLNILSEKLGQPYDSGGEMAREGQIDNLLLEKLNLIAHYEKKYPKSLGTEWLENEFYPFIDFSQNEKSNLHTIVEHIAVQVAKIIWDNKLKSVLVTGGGVYNTYLLQRIEHHSGISLTVPSSEIIEYKEALIFAFLGALYLNGENSNVPSATGARQEVRLGVRNTPSNLK